MCVCVTYIPTPVSEVYSKCFFFLNVTDIAAIIKCHLINQFSSLAILIFSENLTVIIATCCPSNFVIGT